MRCRVKDGLGFLAGGVLLVCVVFASTLAAAERLLFVRTPVSVADVMVVLGGEGPPRAAQAARLFLQGLAPRVVISGDGDCDEIHGLMIEAGVPAYLGRHGRAEGVTRDNLVPYPAGARLLSPNRAQRKLDVGAGRTR